MTSFQWEGNLYPVMGSRWYIFIQLPVYITYIPGIFCQLKLLEDSNGTTEILPIFPRKHGLCLFFKDKMIIWLPLSNKREPHNPPPSETTQPNSIPLNSMDIAGNKGASSHENKATFSTASRPAKCPTFSRRKWQRFESFWASPLVAWCKLNHLELAMAMSPLVHSISTAKVWGGALGFAC